MEYSDWEQSYNEVPKWLQAAQQTNPGTIFQLFSPLVNVDGEDATSKYIMERCFWAFGPCIEGFKYCKLIVQVDGTFLTSKYPATLLTAIAQDGNRNIFPLAFAIVKAYEVKQPTVQAKLSALRSQFSQVVAWID
ncbi:uncharacterized protein LOC114188318 [Vigna unguiculata]|uniref:uncharacterized protein LOC114188318 n=1 Tax=Vigna unguiculata TaxID=3917 RepID=UPI001015D9E5|nr:uncharacterized protein LOC114188318 [Vigna unguiculata]